MFSQFKSFAAVALTIVVVLIADQAEAKKFHRALVITGGGISPSLALGILKGAEQGGWKPDVIITTCGASMGGAIYNAYLSADQGLEYTKSPYFHQGLLQVKVNTSNILDVGAKFEGITKNPELVPDFFSGYVLSVPNSVQMGLPETRFNRTDRGPRLIMVAARANFGPQDVGRPHIQKMFTETFFTDPETGKALEGFQSPVSQLAGSDVASETEVVTTQNTEDAMRASISDPYLINPPLLNNGFYYLTGAVDLFPMELAQALADEVVATYPVSLFTGYLDTAFKSAFGFAQTYRTLQILNSHGVKWIDMAGVDDLKFDPDTRFFTLDPKPGFLKIVNRIPADLGDFQKGLQKMYDFGRTRMLEALRLQANGENRSHLREPISPKLYESFTCENAYAWTTAERTSLCQDDSWPNCDRKKTRECIPVR